jgi:hypothetical protein
MDLSASLIPPRLRQAGALGLLSTRFSQDPMRMLRFDGFIAPAFSEQVLHSLSAAPFVRRWALRQIDHPPNGAGLAVDERAFLAAPPERQLFVFSSLQPCDDGNNGRRNLPLFLVMSVLASKDFVHWLSQVTGMPLERPVLEVHRMDRGDFIRPHSDDRAARAVGLFIYFCRSRPDGRDGELVFRSQDGSVRRFKPLCGRMLVFDVQGHAEHEVHELTGGDWLPRYSLGAWYSRRAV